MRMTTELAIRDALLALWPSLLILLLIGCLWLSGFENEPVQYEGSGQEEEPVLVRITFEWPEFKESPEGLWLRDAWQHEEEYSY